MSDKKDSLGGYMTGTPYPAPQKKVLPHTVPKKQSYKAVTDFVGNEKRERFRLIQKDGTISFYGYSHILEGTLKGDILTLAMTSRNFLITGKNLLSVIDALSNRKVKSLRAFNPATDLPVTDSKAIIIESIELENA